MGHGDPGLEVLGDVLASLVQLHDVSLICRPDVLHVLVHCLVDVMLYVLGDLGGSKYSVHYAGDHREVVVVLEQLPVGLIDSSLDELCDMSRAVVYCEPTGCARGQDIEVGQHVDLIERGHWEETTEALVLQGL